MKINKKKLKEIIREEFINAMLTEAPGEDDPRFGTYGSEKDVPNTSDPDANIDLYQKSVKALNMWVAQKGRPSARTWRGGNPMSFEGVAKRLYPEEL